MRYRACTIPSALSDERESVPHCLLTRFLGEPVEITGKEVLREISGSLIPQYAHTEDADGDQGLNG